MHDRKQVDSHCPVASARLFQHSHDLMQPSTQQEERLLFTFLQDERYQSTLNQKESVKDWSGKVDSQLYLEQSQDKIDPVNFDEFQVSNFETIQRSQKNSHSTLQLGQISSLDLESLNEYTIESQSFINKTLNLIPINWNIELQLNTNQMTHWDRKKIDSKYKNSHRRQKRRIRGEVKNQFSLGQQRKDVMIKQAKKNTLQFFSRQIWMFFFKNNKDQLQLDQEEFQIINLLKKSPTIPSFDKLFKMQGRIRQKLTEFFQIKSLWRTILCSKAQHYIYKLVFKNTANNLRQGFIKGRFIGMPTPKN